MNKLKANADLVKKADNFLKQSPQLYQSFCTLCSRLIYENIGKSNCLHSDRWSVVYDWLQEQNLEGYEKPNEIETALTEWLELSLHIKEGD